MLVALTQNHKPTAEYIHDLRIELARRFPGVQFSFIPSDIVSQILSFGLPAPIDVQIVGRDYEANRRFAAKLMTKIIQVPGIVDLRVHQVANQPSFEVDVDRTRAAQVGLTPARRRQQPADLAERQRPDLADLLAEPVHRRDLQRGDDDAAVPDEFAAGPQDHPGVGERIGRALADARRGRLGPPRRRARGGLALQRAAGHRHLRIGPGARPRRRRRRHPPDRRRGEEGPAARIADRRPRTDRDDADLVSWGWSPVSAWRSSSSTC